MLVIVAKRGILGVLLLLACVKSFQIGYVSRKLRQTIQPARCAKAESPIRARNIFRFRRPPPSPAIKPTISFESAVTSSVSTQSSPLASVLAPPVPPSESFVAVLAPEIRNSRFENVINSLVTPTQSVQKVLWGNGKLEITLINTIDGVQSSPTLDELDAFLRALYAKLEADPELDKVLEKFEVEVSSPGIGDELLSDRDFVTFKGFDVIITTTEPFQKLTRLLGTVHERTSKHVVINVKGRKVKIPRDIVLQVKFPPARSEPM